MFAATRTAAAGNFSLAPIRVELDPGHRSEVLTVHNEDDAPVTIQISAVAWSQASGEEQFADTRELLVTPPVLQVPAHGERIVRVALRREPDTAQELSYRLFFQEVPQASATNFNGLKVALRVSLPVFVAAGTPGHADLQWQARWQQDGSLRLEADNRGLMHQQLTGFDVQLGDRKVPVQLARYVLPGSRISWDVKLPTDAAHDAPLRVSGLSDLGAFQADVRFTPGP
ncbi:MAG: fimbria/pilus periplasmic chaperone [Steroidobacteraceae bacterium]